MEYKRVLTIQDISCVGQCSLTVALPILSACGMETAILPSAVLSTHTGGFKGFTFRDLSDDMPAILEHWKKEGITFDSIYTGYLGSIPQIDYVCSIIDGTLRDGGKVIVDPAMADNGKLYSIFDMDYVNAMKKLCAKADYFLPNITEACFLTGIEYRQDYDQAYITSLLHGLEDLGCKAVILTGVGYASDTTGVVVYEDGIETYYEHKKLPKSSHGTGDVYASAFVGALMQGHTAFGSAKIAADYTVLCIEKTMGDDSHWYGVKFEAAIPELLEMIK